MERDVGQDIGVGRRPVSQRVGLGVAEEIFHRIQFRSIGGQFD